MYVKLEYYFNSRVKATDMAGDEIIESDLGSLRESYTTIKQTFEEQFFALESRAKKLGKIPIGKLTLELELREDEH